MTSEIIDFSIIIPTRDHAPQLVRLLQSISGASSGDIAYEIIVSDDGSTDDLGPLCAQHGARHLRSETSRGPAAARNAGAGAALGNVFLFLDSDIVYTPGLMENARRLLEADATLQAVSFLSQRYAAGDGAVRNYGAVIEHFWLLHFLDDGAEWGALSGFTTRNGAIRREAFESLHGFDTSFKTNAHEDYDFGKRLARQYRCVIAREPVMYHAFPDKLTRLMRNYFVRTALFVPYFIKNRPPLDKAQTSGAEARLRLVGVAALIFLVLALPPGWWWFALPGCCGLAYYAFSVRGFLKAAWQWSERNKAFVAQCFLIHYASSLVITAGGVWGLITHMRDRLLRDDRTVRDE